MVGAAATATATLPAQLHHHPTSKSNIFRNNKYPHSIHLPSSIPFRHSKIIHHQPSEGLAICHAKSSGGEPEDLKEGSFCGAREVINEDYESDDEEEEEDDDNSESSTDLLFRLLHSMFKKVSKRARKASRSILPDVFSPQLVSFAVDGLLLLASLSILKALLEVVCTLGGTVFVVILLLRVIWAAISYFQSTGTGPPHRSPSTYGRAQPI